MFTQWNFANKYKANKFKVKINIKLNFIQWNFSKIS